MNPEHSSSMNCRHSEYKQNHLCQICHERKQSDKLIRFCHQQHKYCQKCLIDYTATHMKLNFKTILCPSGECQLPLEPNSLAFQILPQNLQSQYQRLVQKIKQIKQKVKYCPSCNKKLSQINQQKCLMCVSCNQKLCRQCLNVAHEFRGKCQINVLFELRIKFKQCPSCRFVVQKSQGCDHMVCLCGHQFCYNCGRNRFSYTNHICQSREGSNRKYSL